VVIDVTYDPSRGLLQTRNPDASKGNMNLEGVVLVWDEDQTFPGGDGGSGVSYGTTAQTVGTANGAGSANSASRSDHVHAHGTQAGGGLHSVCTTTVAGFMSASDKTKLDGVAAGATNVSPYGSAASAVSSTSSAGTSSQYARGDHVHSFTEDFLRSVASQLTQALGVGNQQITSLADPTTAQAASTRNYVDTVGPTLGLANSIVISGSQTLLAAAWASTSILFTGTLTADTTVNLQSVPGRRCLFKNGTTGAYWFKITGSGGGSTYLAPGQSKILWTDSAGVLQGEDLSYWACDVDASLVIGSATTTTLATVKLPPRLRLQPVLVSGLTTPTAGTTQNVGTASAGTQLLKATASPAQDAIVGHLAAHLGTDADDGGAFFYGTSQTLFWQSVSANAISVGSSRLHLQGKVL
jgi:hypothetical protein